MHTRIKGSLARGAATRRGLAAAALWAALLAPALAPAQGKPARAETAPVVAVLYFEYTGKSADLEQLRKGWARMLISDLGANPAFQLVERDRLEEVLAELKLGRSKKVDAATAAKVGKLLGARYLVLGGYFDLGGTLRVDARVVEVESGKVLKSVGLQRKPDEFLALEQKLAADLGEALAVAVSGAAPRPPAAKPTPGARPVKRRPASPRRLKAAIAARYGRALDAKDRGNKKLARAELKKVVQAQPDFELAAADLAELAK